MLNPNVKDELKRLLNQLSNEGRIYSNDKLDEYYQLFQNKFSPGVLKDLEGEELINRIHNFNDRDSLVYWLEFKNDEELPAHFGSIAGGSALKYGIYFNREKGKWFTGSSTNQIEVSVSDAIDFVKKQRDQLIAGYNVLRSLPEEASLDEYLRLQERLEVEMPDLSDLAWVHKYLSMNFPNKIDDYHNAYYQKYHLIKILVEPEETKGRYINAYYYKEVASELETSMNSLTTVLNHRNGKPQNYWRIGTTSGNDGESMWSSMIQGTCIAVGWDEIQTDLSFIEKKNASKERLKEIMTSTYPDKIPQVIGRLTQQLFNFLAGTMEGDIVIAMEGATVKGIGKISGDYYYVENAESFRHRKPVKWLSSNDWRMEEPEGLQTTVACFKKNSNKIKIENRILDDINIVTPVTNPNPTTRSNSIINKIESIVKRKGQVILYGPPGTGKTFWARKAAFDITARKNFNRQFESLTAAEQNSIEKEYVGFCSFHPNYGYEDFIEAYRPQENNSTLSFKLTPGIFKRLCKSAEDNLQKTYFLIIDEINRGDIPRIFGELITLLEKDKRNMEVKLPVSGQSFSVPPNINIIATMNTADRSIALLDTALRRRFGFIEMMPDYSVLNDSFVDDIPLDTWLKILNKRIRTNLGQNGRNLQIGHAYLLAEGRPVSDTGKFTNIVREDIIPLLEEYTYEDFTLLGKILSKELVDTKNLKINFELLENANWGTIKQSLYFDDPEILIEGKEHEESIIENNDEMDEE